MSAIGNMHETLLSTRLFDVERREFTLDTEENITREVIVHPGAVVVLPLLDDGRIVMIRNHRYAAGEELLELAAGTLEPGESPIDAAVRELEEETGFAAGRVEPFLEFFTTPGICTELMRTFIARDLTERHQRLEVGERIRVEIIEPNDARRAVFDGRIRDGKTIALLGAYFLRSDDRA